VADYFVALNLRSFSVCHRLSRHKHSLRSVAVTSFDDSFSWFWRWLCCQRAHLPFCPFYELGDPIHVNLGCAFAPLSDFSEGEEWRETSTATSEGQVGWICSVFYDQS
jgi:hypothetical protein